ncbi:CDP-alcohol phosphatidyltransferase family protein [Candidatus Woesearchaeota archaeon]|nr:CDP-alcohol phosphatidyltransferase family protein [Candidatus Woesearchaeota archaeon]
MKKFVLNVPNTLTILRFLLSPVFFVFLLKDKLDLALITFMFVAVTDFADGWIARFAKQETYFGRTLDPLADKFMIFLAVIALAKNFAFPFWAIPLILSRDFVSILGLALFSKRMKEWKVYFLGKLTTFLQVITVLAFIVSLEYKEIILWLTLAISVITAVVYLTRGAKEFFSPKQ